MEGKFTLNCPAFSQTSSRQEYQVEPNNRDRHQLRIIAVDLTPVLPGGENGGAKVFVLELLRRLAELAPQTQFVLLTQASAHEELASLDRPNVRRLMILGQATPNNERSRAELFLSRLFRHLPVRWQSIAGKVGHTILSASKRSESTNLLRSLNADLLFCPFTAPTYSEPTTPAVSVIYDLQYKAYPEFFTPEEVIERGRTFVAACKRSAMLTAISDFSRREAIEQGD
ncbi:MAG: hypothetical protein ABIL01_10775, partial [Pseudomonadota bacterium]